MVLGLALISAICFVPVSFGAPSASDALARGQHLLAGRQLLAGWRLVPYQDADLLRLAGHQGEREPVRWSGTPESPAA